MGVGRREKPLDPAAGPVAEFAFALRKLRQEAGGPTYSAMARRAGAYSVATLSRAAGGELLPTLPVVLAYVAACGGDPQEWAARWRLVSEELTAAPADDEADEPSPYRGLARFEPGDSELFFGRDRAVADLLALVREHRVVTLFGASGSGKSSLLRAGLIPQLRDTGPGRPRPAAIRILTPGEHPLDTHGPLLAPAGAEGDGDTWLIVDQFEELFTLCHDATERTRFIDALLEAGAPGRRLRVVLGVRADFYARCLEHAGLAAAIRDASLPVGRMTPAELRQAITKPAAARGLIVERALTEALVEEVSAHTGGLPMLSHALLETWRRRRGRTLTLEAYERAGGIRGAIAQSAEAAYTRLGPAQAETARQIMLRMITPGVGVADTRRPTPRAELEAIRTVREANTVLEILSRARLISLDEDTADLAHEALITSWPRLHDWIEEDRETLRLHRWLTEAAAAWDSVGRDPGVRIPPVRLARLAEFTTAATGRSGHTARTALTALEADFIAAGSATHRRTIRRRRTARTVISLLAVLAILAGTAAWQQSRSEDRRRVQNAALRTAALAESMRGTDPVTAGRLSIAAWNLADTTETRAALLGSRAHRPEPDFAPLDGDTRDYGGMLSPDGRTLTLHKKDRLEQWDITSHRRTGSRVLPGAPNAPRRHPDGRIKDLTDWLRLSPDGRRAVAAVGGVLRNDVLVPGEVHVWDVASGERRTLHPGPNSSNFGDVSWGADSRWLALNVDGRVELWDAGTGQRTFAVEGDEHARAAAVSADGGRIALCGKDGRIQVWSAADRRRLSWGDWDAALAIDPRQCEGGRLVFSPDGSMLAVMLDSGILGIDLSSGRSRQFTEHGLREFVFSADSHFIAALKKDAVLVWRSHGNGNGADDQEDAPVFALDLPNETPSGLAIDTEGQALRYLRTDGLTVATVDIGSVLNAPWLTGQQPFASVSPDGRHVIRGAKEGATVTLGLYDLHTGAQLAALPLVTGTGRVHEPVVAGFSPDSRLFAYGIEGFGQERGVVLLWDLTARRTVAELPVPDGGALTGGLHPFWRDGKPGVYATTDSGLWELASGKRLAELSLTGTFAVTFDSHLAAFGNGAMVSLPTGTMLRRPKSVNPGGAAAFSPDRSSFAAADDTGRVMMWSGLVDRVLGILSPESADALSGRRAAVEELAFSADSRTLATGDSLGRVRLWDTETLRPLGGPLPTPGDPIRGLGFSADGGTLYVQGAHTPLLAYDVHPETIAAALCTRFGGPLSRDRWADHIHDVPHRDTCRPVRRPADPVPPCPGDAAARPAHCFPLPGVNGPDSGATHLSTVVSSPAADPSRQSRPPSMRRSRRNRLVAPDCLRS
ncbi:DNA-binding protein [Streptomyces sp. NPDC002054]|uniref:nSTAND1 domain-containing NTPase n=1 Tax=Streptomyces sp. NPDC002054 TaxID=3154663 RepID=UPI003319FCD8